MILDFITSKKATMTITGLVTTLFVHLGLDLPEEQATEITELILYFVGTYVLGQGIADAGKHITK